MPFRVWGKALCLFLFLITALCLVRVLPVRTFLTPHEFDHFLGKTGTLAPLLFVLIYAGVTCFLVPATFPTLLGVAVFGTHTAFLLSWIGALLGASGAFLIGRTLGRDFAASLIGDRLRRYDEGMARNGFTTVLYLRLIQFPFTVLNYGMGLTRVHFKDYALGTGLGIIVGLYVLTHFGGALKQVWISGRWEGLMSFNVFFAAALFIVSFFIPRILKKIAKITRR